MFPIAGQMAKSNELNFFVDTHGWPGGVIGKKNRNFFLQIFFSDFCSTANAGPFS